MFIEVIKKKAKWYWRIVSPNKHVMAHSEQYSRRWAAVRAAKQVVRAKFKLVLQPYR